MDPHDRSIPIGSKKSGRNRPENVAAQEEVGSSTPPPATAEQRGSVGRTGGQDYDTHSSRSIHSIDRGDGGNNNDPLAPKTLYR